MPPRMFAVAVCLGEYFPSEWLKNIYLSQTNLRELLWPSNLLGGPDPGSERAPARVRSHAELSLSSLGTVPDLLSFQTRGVPASRPRTALPTFSPRPQQHCCSEERSLRTWRRSRRSSSRSLRRLRRGH